MPDDQEIAIRVNGEERSVEPGTTVLDLVTLLGLEGRPVAVERNQAVLRRAQHAEVVLQDGDVLEVVTLVGGG
ncbi:MAG: sulfur carrier protein ThiS [Planctomycetota bacterium]